MLLPTLIVPAVTPAGGAGAGSGAGAGAGAGAGSSFFEQPRSNNNSELSRSDKHLLLIVFFSFVCRKWLLVRGYSKRLSRINLVRIFQDVFVGFEDPFPLVCVAIF